MKKCEICGHELQWELKDMYDEKCIYKLCSNCLFKLVNLMLSKKEFFKLLKNGHTTDEHLLHGDFYDENSGEALQPTEIST